MQWIERCLQCCAAYPTVVVDNNSTDGTVAFIKSNFPSVQLFEETANLGFGQANNKGISWALRHGYSNVFLLNQDAYLEANCLETLQTVSDQHPDYGILSPIHLNGKGDQLDQRFATHVSFKKNPVFISDVVLGHPKQNVYALPFVNAAAWWITKKCLDTVGGFDPLFFHYGEDDNYCQRVLYHGFKIGIVPDSFIRHDREERLLKNPKNNDASELVTTERRLKKRYGNILEQNEAELIALRRKRSLESWKSLLKLDFSAHRRQKNEARLIKRLLPKIKQSRLLNVQPSSHYLENETTV